MDIVDMHDVDTTNCIMNSRYHGYRGYPRRVIVDMCDLTAFGVVTPLSFRRIPVCALVYYPR